MNDLKIVAKIIGTHALLVGTAAASATVAYDLFKLVISNEASS